MARADSGSCAMREDAGSAATTRAVFVTSRAPATRSLSPGGLPERPAGLRRRWATCAVRGRPNAARAGDEAAKRRKGSTLTWRWTRLGADTPPRGSSSAARRPLRAARGRAHRVRGRHATARHPNDWMAPTGSARSRRRDRPAISDATVGRSRRSGSIRCGSYHPGEDGPAVTSARSPHPALQPFPIGTVSCSGPQPSIATRACRSRGCRID